MNLSENITLEQAVKSATADKNKVDNNTNDTTLIQNMQSVALNICEPTIAHFGKDKYCFDSFYRCDKLNTLIRGATNSQHVRGQAVDQFLINSISNCELFLWQKDNLQFDQLILEMKNDKTGDAIWVHGSYNAVHNRKMCLIAHKDFQGKSTYSLYTKELFNETYPNHKIV